MMETMPRLKDETREEHKATERTELARAILGGTISLAEYRAQLAFYLAVHAEIDARCENLPRVAHVAGARSSTARLRADLAHLGGEGPLAPALRDATAKTCRFVEEASEATLLGVLYVLEGSALGAAILHPRLGAALAIGHEGLTYYRGNGAATFAEWRAFGERVNAAVATRSEEDAMVAGARAAFVHVRAAFEAIHAESGHATSMTARRSPESPLTDAAMDQLTAG